MFSEEGNIMNMKEIVKGLKERDEDAFRIVYDQYEKLIYYVAYSITKNRENSEEIVQDTFLRMFNTIYQYEEQGKFKQWLCEIARNLSYNKVTRDKEKNTLRNEEMVHITKSPKSSADIILTIEGILEPFDANIVILRIVYDFSFREIAESINETIGKVQSSYYSSLDKLKKEFHYE